MAGQWMGSVLTTYHRGDMVADFIPWLELAEIPIKRKTFMRSQVSGFFYGKFFCLCLMLARL